MRTLLASLALVTLVLTASVMLPWVSYDQQFADCVNKYPGQVAFCDALIPQE